MKNMNLKKGFTLIELLVVIAIIGILSSVVLASLNTARSKGADAAVKNNLANIRSQAELVYDEANPNSYAGVCTNPIVDSAFDSAVSAGGSDQSNRCNSVANSWAASVRLRTTNVVSSSSGTDYWCVDSTGASRLVDSGLANTTTYVCPTS